MPDSPASVHRFWNERNVDARTSPVPEWDAGCRNTDATGMGLDARAQLCLCTCIYGLVLVNTYIMWQRYLCGLTNNAKIYEWKIKEKESEGRENGFSWPLYEAKSCCNAPTPSFCFKRKSQPICSIKGHLIYRMRSVPALYLCTVLYNNKNGW
jgi:hypothetical protein